MKFKLSKAMADVQWAFISIVTASVAHFLIRTIIGRDLGAEGLGVYTLAFTVYLFGMQFAAFGIGSALTKFVAELQGEVDTIRNYVSSGMTSSIITGALIGSILFLLASFIANAFFKTPELEELIKVTALCYPSIAVQKAVLGTLNGFRMMHKYAFLNIVQNVTMITFSIFFVKFFNMGVMGAVIGYVLTTILVSALCPLMIRNYIRFDSSLWNIPALHATTIFGLYVVLGNSIGFLNTQVDSLLIGYYLDPTEVGTYAVAVLIAQMLTLLPSAVQRVTAPLTATLYGKGDIEGVRILFYSTLKKSLIVSIGCAAFITIFSPYIITLLFTEEFSVSYTPLLILLIGYTLGSSFAAVGATLSSIGKVHILFRINAICGVLNLILNVLLIPIIKINGAALSTTLTMVVNFIITIKVIRNYF